ncbi:MAG: gliding motility lipoprotein GldD [Flavobacteriales bacterium]|nr:MAG: gliding motility lipoprotein GldD [Flavobacteriales bacterium]PIE48865.1 MAG: gliding motility lipoprotein GldD [Flavobacteriales bacterium]
MKLLSTNNLLFFLILAVLTSCTNEDLLPKPKAFLRLTYEPANYEALHSDCPYTFEISDKAIVNFKENCWANIAYPQLNASIDITYRPVENNITTLLQEAEKLTYNHAIKADGISGQPYENTENKKYGALLEVTGNAASPIQFHLTDSVRHFITGALYFKVQPNYDSVLPAARYIEKDIKHLMETLRWQD